MCEKCAVRDKSKVYSVEANGRTLWFDVERALKLAANLPTNDAPEWLLKDAVQVNDFIEEHLPHVDMTDPLLFGQLPLDEFSKNGVDARRRDRVNLNDPKAKILVFLDGSHRAVRALRENATVQLRMLSVEQTLQCLVTVTVP